MARSWFVVTLLVGSSALAQDETALATPRVDFGAYVEWYYGWNFNDPGNEVTNFRGFDNRHNAFTLSNIALDSSGARDGLSGRITVQFGHTPNTYYLAEPAFGATSGAGETDRFTWRFVQQAYLGWQPERAPDVLLEAGLFLSPIGPEGIAVKDNWNWSRSNLFFGLPFYHTGLRCTWTMSGTTKLTGYVLNGWNSVVDNNRPKTVAAQLLHSRNRFDGSVLYMGGVERPSGAPEGEAWRNLFDAWGRVQAAESLWFMLHANAGIESNDLGDSSWYAAADYARLRLAPWLYTCARGDWFVESADAGTAGTPSPIFWGTFDADGEARVASATLTLEAVPRDGLSVRGEYRYDDANVELFFENGGDAVTQNAQRQSTVTLGTVVWF